MRIFNSVFFPGTRITQCTMVNIEDDGSLEEDEFFLVTLTILLPDSNVREGNAVTNITIIDNDGKRGLHIHTGFILVVLL